MDSPIQDPPIDTEKSAVNNSASESPTDASQSASTLVSKHRKERADKGKTRGARSSALPQDPVNPAISDETVRLNLQLVEKSVRSLVTTSDAMVCRRVFSRSIRAGLTKELAVELVQTAGVSKDELEVVSQCTSSIVSRSAFLTEHAPEFMLGCFVISYGTRIVAVLNRLDNLEKELKAANRNGKMNIPDMNESRAQ